jgi:hypothetical protein
MYSDIMAACNVYLASGHTAITSVPMKVDMQKLVKTEIENCSK